MRATADATRRTGDDEEAATETDLARRTSRLIGEFVDQRGEVHRCRISPAAERDEQLVHVTCSGRLICLGWVADASAAKEAEAIWADYRAASGSERWARPVSVGEVESLQRKHTRRRNPGTGGGEQEPCLKGAELVEWMVAANVIAEGHSTELGDDSKVRRVCAWRSGDQASLRAVDEILTAKGVPLSEIPEEIWQAKQMRLPATAKTRAEAGRRYLAGEEVAELARHYGASTHTIRRWGYALQAEGAGGRTLGAGGARVAA